MVLVGVAWADSVGFFGGDDHWRQHSKLFCGPRFFDLSLVRSNKSGEMGSVRREGSPAQPSHWREFAQFCFSG